MNQELKLIIRADGTAKVVGDMNKVNAGIVGTKSSAMGLNSTLANIGKSILSIALVYKSFTMLKAQIADSVKYAEEAEIAFRKLQTALNNAGITAKSSAFQFQSLASELQKVSNFGDEDILTGVTVELLKFKSISMSTLPAVHKVVLDIAESMGGGAGSLANAARLAGIALEDPIIGLTRLRRSGVIFDESQQAMIKTLVESGSKLEAQGIMLDALQQKFGGMAQAGIKASTQLKNAYSDWLEGQGNAFKSMLQSMQRGLTVYLYSINSAMAVVDESMMKQQLDMQEHSSLLIAKTIRYGQQSLTILGGVIVSTVTVSLDAIKVLNVGIQNSMNAAIGLTERLWKASGNVLPNLFGGGLREAWQGLKDDLSGISGLKGIDELGLGTSQAIKNWKGTFQNFTTDMQKIAENNKAVFKSLREGLGAGLADFSEMNIDLPAIAESIMPVEEIKKNIDHVLEIIAVFGLSERDLVKRKYSELKDEVRTYYGEVEGMEKDSLLTILQLNVMQTTELNKISAANLAKLEQMEQERLTNRMNANLQYLQMTSEFSQAYFDAQISQYQAEVDAYQQMGLSKIQIEEMVNAKRWELSESMNAAQIEQFKQQNELQFAFINNFVNAWANAFTRVLQIQTTSQSIAVQAMTNFINMMIAEIMRFIAKQIVSAMLMQIIGGNIVSGLPTGWFKSGNINVGSPVVDNGNTNLIRAINRLNERLDNNQNQIIRVYVDPREISRASEYGGLQRVYS